MKRAVLALAVAVLTAGCIMGGCSKKAGTEDNGQNSAQAGEAADSTAQAGEAADSTAQAGVLLSTYGSGAKNGKEFYIVNNTGDKADIYPYLIETETSVWYISAADLATMGENEMYSELNEVLQYQDDMFLKAQEVLKGQIHEDIPRIDIHTDFGGKAQVSDIASAYYNRRSNFIKVFHSWDDVKVSLVHEYVHYLTMQCTDTPLICNAFLEGIAEYVNYTLCDNELIRSIKFAEDLKATYKQMGVWDDARDCKDFDKFCKGEAHQYTIGIADDQQVCTVRSKYEYRRAYSENYPAIEDISYREAYSLMAFLDLVYGREFFISHLNCSEEEFEQVFGVDFHALYNTWRYWNLTQCRDANLDVTYFGFNIEKDTPEEMRSEIARVKVEEWVITDLSDNHPYRQYSLLDEEGKLLYECKDYGFGGNELKQYWPYCEAFEDTQPDVPEGADVYEENGITTVITRTPEGRIETMYRFWETDY